MKPKKQDAIELRDHAISAIRELSKSLNAAVGRYSEEDYQRIKKAVGLSIGQIQVDILAVINSYYPELDDLVKTN